MRYIAVILYCAVLYCTVFITLIIGGGDSFDLILHDVTLESTGVSYLRLRGLLVLQGRR